jgi:glycosyltransferase involved in cell wall biosynthesis
MSRRRSIKVAARRAGEALRQRVERLLTHRSFGPIIRAGLRGARPSRSVAAVPAIPQPRGFTGPNALVIVPWSEDNGSTQVIDALNASLRALGFRIHVVVSNHAGPNAPRLGWDYTYSLGNSPEFGRPARNRGRLVLDGHRVDDWVGEDLTQFVADVDRAWRFDVVVCHYVFLSRVLEVVNDSATTILVTHDRFAGRNSLFAERGMTASYFFSTTEDEEAIGLRRADHVVALQEDEAQYFRGAVAGTASCVHLLPLLGPPQFQDPPPPTARLRVGFLGSSYANNRTALVNFFRDVRGEDLSELEFIVGGGVCDVLERDDLPRGSRLIGRVERLADFYTAVDVVFNPDFVRSGRKVKVFEGLSFGVPVVTTRESTAGFDTLPPEMALESNAAILDHLRSFAVSRDGLERARDRARATYVDLVRRFDTSSELSRMIAGRDSR